MREKRKPEEEQMSDAVTILDRARPGEDPAGAEPELESQEKSMARYQRRKRKRRVERGSLQLIEEAFHLLRTASAGTIFTFYLGTIPFVVGLFYFWADMSQSSFAVRDSPVAAAGMTIGYFWMKGWHAVFCRKLWTTLNPGQGVELGGWMKIRYFAAQVVVQVFAVPILILAAIALIPLPWAYAFFQNATALGFTRDYGKKPLRKLIGDSFRLSFFDWPQNLGVMTLMKLVAIITWLNVVLSIVYLTQLAKSFFGIESVFTTNPLAAFLNTTFFFGTILIAFLVVSPLLKSIYVLRCFYADSRQTGADLLSRLAARASGRGREKRTPGVAVGIVLFLSIYAWPSQGSAQETGTSLPPITVERLDDSIRDTMTQKRYQWRFERLEQGSGESEQSWFNRTLTDFAESIKTTMDRISKAIDRFVDNLFNRGDRAPTGSGRDSNSGVGEGIGTVFTILLIVILTALIGWVVYLLIKRSADSGPIDLDEMELSGTIDLESEHIVASQLHEDEWMKLAREKIAAGESRLAIRALFLASLAHLGDRGLLRIQKFKSNRDYTRELDLKARTLPELQSAFHENVSLFERVWYGLHQIGDDAVDHFTGNYERIAAQQSVHEQQQNLQTTAASAN
ncbi:MAG: DUF4129 domain-containing protein [Verrucomicrobiales bacterium]|nr:DUF4129 domain-containing protein [Verrucomicrobiales bacterium]